MEISNQEPTPVAKSALFVDSLYRGGTLLRIFMTDFLRSRKSKGLVVVGLLPTIIVILTQAGLDRPQIFYYDVFATIYVTFLLPLFAKRINSSTAKDSPQ